MKMGKLFKESVNKEGMYWYWKYKWEEKIAIERVTEKICDIKCK